MTWKPDRYRELRAFLRRGRVEEEVDEEIRAHLEMQVADSVARGMSPEEARQDALRRFGMMDRIRSETIEVDRSAISEERRMELFDTVRRETWHALRGMIKRPGFALVAILTLALGLGGTTAIFALLDSVVLNPLPYDDADELVYVASPVPLMPAGGEWGMSTAGYFEFARTNRSLETMGAYYGQTVNAMGEGEAERVKAAIATRSFLDVLRARAQVGRLFDAADDAPGAPGDVVVLSDAFWRARYGGQTDAIGRTLTVSGLPRRIIGVMEPGFHTPWGTADVWLPARFDPAAPPVNSHFLTVIARLRPEATLAAAAAEAERFTASLPRLFPTAYSEAFLRETGFITRVTDLRTSVVGETARLLWILLSALGLVLLIACANVANLFLVRTESRQREVAIRTAMGAERIQLALHYVMESLLLCMVGAVVALALAWAGLKLLLGLEPSGLPRLDEVRLGRDAVLFAFACAGTAGIVFGLFPLLRKVRTYEVLRDGGRANTASRSRHRVRSALVVVQIALSLLLLGGAGLLVRSFSALRATDPGVRPEGVLTYELSLPWGTYDSEDRQVAFFRELTDRLRALPGVEHVGVTNYVPLRAVGGCALVFFEGRTLAPGEQAPCPVVAAAGPGAFEALGMRVRGRTPDWRDLEQNTGAVLVTDAFARTHFPDEDAIGKGVRGNGPDGPHYRIVGVIENALGSSVDEDPVVAVIYPLRAIPGARLWTGSGATTVIVRTSLPAPQSLLPSIRGIMNEIDRTIPIANPRTLAEIVQRSMERTSLTMRLLLIAAVMSVLLSGVGLYGVVAYVVNQRRAEIGVRMALGARVAQVRGMVVAQSLRLAVLGVAIGILGALASARLLQSFLYGVGPADPVTLGAVSILLIVVAAAASWIPAMRAARVQPMQVLRED